MKVWWNALLNNIQLSPLDNFPFFFCHYDKVFSLKFEEYFFVLFTKTSRFSIACQLLIPAHTIFIVLSRIKVRDTADFHFLQILTIINDSSLDLSNFYFVSFIYDLLFLYPKVSTFFVTCNVRSCWMFCTYFALVVYEICVQCRVWLSSVVPWI